MNDSGLGSDPVYKRLYAFQEMVADLLRSVLPANALGAVDLRSLDKVPASYVGDDFRQRHGDTVWRLRADGADGSWAYALVLLEFQSGSDGIMALRILQYTAMLYHELLRGGSVKAGRLPPVLPVVLYNGESPWRAARDVGELIVPTGPALAAYQPSQRYAVVDARHATVEYAGELTRAVALLERSRSPADLARVAERLAGLLDAPGQDELRRAFADWLWVLCARLRSGDEPPPPELTLEYLCCKWSFEMTSLAGHSSSNALRFRRGLGAAGRRPRSAGGWRRRRRMAAGGGAGGWRLAEAPEDGG